MSIPLQSYEGNPNDHVINTYIDQLANSTPESVRPSTAIKKTKKYLFRTKPGTVRSLRLRVPGVPSQMQYQEKPDSVKIHPAEHAQRRYEKQYPDPKERERHQRIIDANDSMYLAFTKIPNKHECYFQTNSDDEAALIRAKINAGLGDWSYVFEDTGGMLIRSKYTDDLFENTPAGMSALYAHDRIQEMALEAAKELEAKLAVEEAAKKK